MTGSGAVVAWHGHDKHGFCGLLLTWFLVYYDYCLWDGGWCGWNVSSAALLPAALFMVDGGERQGEPYVIVVVVLLPEGVDGTCGGDVEGGVTRGAGGDDGRGEHHDMLCCRCYLLPLSRAAATIYALSYRISFSLMRAATPLYLRTLLPAAAMPAALPLASRAVC